MMAHAFCAQEGIPLIYNRIFSAFGDGQYSGNFYPALKYAAEQGLDFPMTKGDQVRDFIPVETVAEAFVKNLEGPSPAPDVPLIRNIGTGKGVTVLEFAQQWWSFWNAKGILRPGQVPSRSREPHRFVAMLADS